MPGSGMTACGSEKPSISPGRWGFLISRFQPLLALVERVLALKDATPIQTEALLGGRAEPELTLTEALGMFWELSKDKVVNKSDHQVRKWKNPRRKAVGNFVALVGDKPLKTLTRSDMIAFRDWWLERIRNEHKSADSANKNLLHLRSVLETVSDHHQLGLDIEHLFKKILLRVRYRKTRLPLAAGQITAILNSDRLNNMHQEAKWFLHMIAETGARPAELVGLLPEDIRLDDPIPHIRIRSHDSYELKTDHSERVIPLVGYALDAFRMMPQGFQHYRNKSDILTTAVNKFLRSNKLVPDKYYTCYSFRHSFQDRILRVNAPDKVQAELMGHKFDRPMYGDGASLEQKLEWMGRVCVKDGC